MSALPLKADMLIVGINVCYVPIADIGSLLDLADKPRVQAGHKTHSIFTMDWVVWRMNAE